MVQIVFIYLKFHFVTAAAFYVALPVIVELHAIQKVYQSSCIQAIRVLAKLTEYALCSLYVHQ